MKGTINKILKITYKFNLNNILYFLRNFLEYDWGMEAFMIAHDQMVKGRKDLLIVILKENINVDKLPADLRVYIRKYTCFCKVLFKSKEILFVF